MPTKPVTYRLEESLLQRIEKAVEVLQKQNPYGTVSKNSVVAGILEEGVTKILKEATPMKETKTFKTLLEAAEEMCIKTYNDGIYDNQTEKGYCVVNENGEVVTAINQRGIFQHNTDEELQNMDWQLFAEEYLEIEGLDKNQEGTFSVEPI